MKLFLYSFIVLAFYLHFVISIKKINLKCANKPHIIVILADDLGWNDVGFHGSNEIPTPNIDALCYNGVILNRHYTLPTCTPSRTAFFTGRYPIRMGLQGLPINVAEPRGIPLHEKLLPEFLKKLGYVTRLVGKWHLGYYTDNHTPTRRGFDSFVGYYGGYIKYFNHTVTKNKHNGIDFHSDTPQNIKPYNNDRYFTDFLTDEAESIIKNHKKEQPLYLHLSHLASHASENVDFLEVSNMTEVNETFKYIPNIYRRRYAGIVKSMDESIGKVVKALSDASMLNNSVILFLSDNGAPTAIVPFSNYGSNYPLRGMKSTLFEGGVRTPSCVYSPLIKNRSRVSQNIFHISDWFPTLYKLASGNLSTVEELDGIDQWSAISGTEKHKRNSILLNIDEVIGQEAAIVGKYKLIRGTNTYGDYYGVSGVDYSPKTYNVTEVLSSLTMRAIQKISNNVFLNEKKIATLRKKATVDCKRTLNYSNDLSTYLFNIEKDPCETTDISDKHPQILNSINAFIDNYRSVLVNQTNTYIDTNGYPENFKGYWMPWLQNEYTPPENRNKSIIWSADIFCEGLPVNDPKNCL